jgi:hypothetical protein
MSVRTWKFKSSYPHHMSSYSNSQVRAFTPSSRNSGDPHREESEHLKSKLGADPALKHGKTEPTARSFH